MRAKLLCIAFTGILLAAWPLDGHAAGKLIAAIMSSDQPRYREAHRAFVKSLTARGYDPATTEIILQSPNPDPLSWSNTIRKFNAYKPDLILAYGASASLAAMKESTGIPIVSADIYATDQPVKGLCGVSSRVPMITLLKTMQEIRPYKRIGILYTSREIGSKRQADDIKKVARQLGIMVAEGNYSTTAVFDASINAFIDGVDVLITTESSVISKNIERLISRANSHNKPVASTIPGSAEKGALVSLEINPQEQGHLAAEIAVRILEGAAASQLSLLTPRRVELIVNMLVAHEIGINLPFTVLNNATRIIK